MKKFSMLAPLALVLAFSVNPTRADEQQESKLAFELTALREAWLYGDDATAAARLDTLRNDNRLSGDLPRWLGSMRAVLALEAGDTVLAAKVLQPVLASSTDARNYLRAARLLLAYGAPQAALQVIRDGRVRAPDSRALMRFEAGLLWLADDYDAALAAYTTMLVVDDRPRYPYIAPTYTRWAQVKPWGAADKPAAEVPAQPEIDEWDEEMDEPANGQYQPEPFADLFMPIHWFPCDLPGLDRCIETLSRDAAQVKARAEGFPAMLKAAASAQEAVDTLRSGDLETRKQLEEAARRARWQAVIAARIAAMAGAQQGEYESCEKLAASALAIAPDDTALLDLQALALGKLGRAEEARTGPLARLRSVAWLGIYPNTLYMRGPARQIVDRVFEPALSLYRANKEAGLTQLDVMRTTFGDTNRNQPVYAGTIGLWLYLQGEHELARTHLVEASRLNGYESGRPLYQDSIMVEMALVAIGDGEPKPKEEAPKPVPAEGEVDPLKVATLDANTHPLLRKTLRAGAVIGAIPDSRMLMRQLVEIDIYSIFAGILPVQLSAAFLPEGEKLMQEMLWGLPARVADEVPDAELEAFLADSHITSETLKTAMKSLSELIEQSRSSTNWQVRQALSQKTAPVLGLIEGRAILLRARMLKDKPATLAALKEWLAKWQGQIDLRAGLQSRPGEEYARYRAAREKAGVPEIVHTGLLVDAARLLARAGAHADAARLLWCNRDAALGLETQNHLLALAAVLAGKGGDLTMARRCRLESAQRAPDPRARNYVNPQQLLVELAVTRADLLEFGETADLLGYLENQLIPLADSPDMAQILRVAPELGSARHTLVMRNSSRTGTDGIFSNSVTGGSCNVIARNWSKLMVSPDTYDNCRRFAGWVIASDLPLATSSYSGLCSTQDAITGWMMLRELYRRRGANEPVALAAFTRLDKLVQRTHTVMDEPAYRDDEWWD